MAEIAESAKPPTFALSFAARTRHAWLARLTRARRKRYIREGNALLYDFWYFWSYKSTIKEKVSLSIFTCEQCSPLPCEFKVQYAAKRKNQSPILFFFCICRRKRKSYQKEKRRYEISCSAEHLPCLGDADRVCSANRSIPRRRRLFIRFFFCHRRRKRKSYQKEKRRYEISCSAEHDKGAAH